MLAEEYHLKIIIDLRTNVEREEQPDYEIPGVCYLKTNKVNAPKAGQYYEHILAEKKDEWFAAEVKDALLAKKEYLDAAYDGLREIREMYLKRDSL